MATEKEVEDMFSRDEMIWICDWMYFLEVAAKELEQENVKNERDNTRDIG